MPSAWGRVPLRHDDRRHRLPRAAESPASRLSTGTVTADAYVVALGSYSPLLLRRIGIDLPVYPVKGYSLTVPITDPAGAPESTVMDETYKVAITRLGRPHPGRRHGRARWLRHEAAARAPRDAGACRSTDLFPRAATCRKATFWCGLRPMTPDGPPVIGATKYQPLSQYRPRHAGLDHGAAVQGVCSPTSSRASGRRSTWLGSRSTVMPALSELSRRRQAPKDMIGDHHARSHRGDRSCSAPP